MGQSKMSEVGVCKVHTWVSQSKMSEVGVWKVHTWGSLRCLK